jgi:hypothetical protein
MPMDYLVFESCDGKLAEIIVAILRNRGYDAGYQTSYPQHAIYIKAERQEEADKIGKIIKDFMEKFPKKQIGALVTYEYDESITKLGKLIPETPMRKRENMIQKIKEKVEKEEW